MDVKIRWDVKGLSIFVPSENVVFVADPAGRMYQVTTPDGTWLRDRYNRWFRLQHHPIPHLVSVTMGEVKEELKTWRKVWEPIYVTLKDDAVGLVKSILRNWIEAFFPFHTSDAEFFRRIYGAIPVLPPDSYSTVYIRIHNGCRWNRCSFCTFYRGTAYHVLKDDEFEDHLEKVKTYWGAGLTARRGIFLGDAGAANLPAQLLIDRIRLMHDVLPDALTSNIHAFMDGFSPSRRTEDEWVELRNLGLKRVSIGIESGDPGELKRWNKPVNLKNLESIIREMRKVGIGINLIFLTGSLVGDSKRHLQMSVKWLKGLGLGPGDRIYLSPYWQGCEKPVDVFRKWKVWLAKWREAVRMAGIASRLYPYYLPRYLIN